MQRNAADGLFTKSSILNDALLISSGGKCEGDGRSVVSPEFIPPSHLIDQEVKHKNADGLGINLMRLSEEMEQFGLTFKITALDPAHKESDDNYFDGFNYSFALSYEF